MRKRITYALLCLTLLFSLVFPAHAEEITGPVEVLINGEAVTGFWADLYDGTAYIPFYGGTLALRPDAQVVWENGQFVATAWDFIMTVRVGTPYLVINGHYLYLSGGVKGEADGTAWVPARTLATALGAWIGWNDRVELCSGGVPLSAETIPYDDATLDLMARVITHESGYQPLRGKMAVGNVILNRVSSPKFPNTVYEVVYQPGQFPGATDYEPNAESILAARLVLEGANVVPGAYWFNGVGKPCWASRTKSLVAEIGGHAFYG